MYPINVAGLRQGVDSDGSMPLAVSDNSRAEHEAPVPSACRTPGAAIHVAWQPTQDGDSQQFGACASYEVQAAPLAGGHPLRQTCSARLHQCSLPDAQPGAIYHVRRQKQAAWLNSLFSASCSAPVHLNASPICSDNTGYGHPCMCSLVMHVAAGSSVLLRQAVRQDCCIASTMQHRRYPSCPECGCTSTTVKIVTRSTIFSQVCVRSVGAGGAGHGTWSTPAAVQLPAAAAPPVLGRGAASDAAHEPTGGKGRKKAASGVGDASGASESRARRRPTEGVACS